MILEMAVADAYGIGFEFCDPDPARPNDLSRYYRNPNYEGPEPGQYTDDTQRAIANAQVMMNGCGFDSKAYAQRYLGIFQASPRKGYSRGYQQFLETTPNEKTFIQNIRRGKASNGGLMGVAPLGYLGTAGEVRLAAAIQAITTHSHITIPFAQGVALAAHFFIYELGDKEELPVYLEDAVEWGDEKYSEKSFASALSRDLNPPKLIQKTTVGASSTFYAMLRGLGAHDNLADIMKWAIECGGDTDSLAAVTVAVASCSKEFDRNIPQVLLDGLEPGNSGPYDTKALRLIDQRLKDFQRQQI